MSKKIKQTPEGIFVMVNDTHLSRWVEQDKRLDHAREYLKRFRVYMPEGCTIVDVGTSIGDHTLTYAEYAGPTGSVWGFEANPDVCECCALNMSQYPWVKILNIGLSDDFGSAGIQIDPNVGASRLTKEGNIKLAPLDSFIGSFGRCDFIKVDIEGFEPRFLNGARNFIGKFKPAILMEVNRAARAAQGFSPGLIFNQLDKLGYRWAVADGQIATPQYDIIAVPKKTS